MNIPNPPPGFILDGAPQTQPTVAPPAGFVIDQPPQNRADSVINTGPSGNPFSPENLQADVRASQEWERHAADLLNSPQRANVEQYAVSKQIPLTPENELQLATEYLKSTVAPQQAQQMEQQSQVESRIMNVIAKRDQLGTVAAQQYIQNHPGASDQDIYKYVHENLLNAGIDNSQLPAFTIDPHTKEVKTDRGLIAGLAARTLAALAAFPTGAAEAGARAIQQGVYQASKPFYGGGPNPYEEAVKRQNEALGAYNQVTETALRGSTFGQAHPAYGLVEEGVAQVPSLLALGGLGRAGLLGKSAEYAQIAGMEFNKAYEHTYNDALAKGLAPGVASQEATVSGAIDAAVNTYLMKFGLLGAKGGAGLKGRLRAALTSAPAQAGVAGAQELVRQVSSYAATGTDPNLEAILHAAISGGVTGAVGGAALGAPHAPAEAAKPGEAAPPVPAPTPEQMANVVQPKVEAPAPTAPPTEAPPVETPKLLETAVPKTRVTQGEKSVGKNLDFENPIDKALFIATESRKGKRSAEARLFLRGKNFSDEAIDAYGGELRDRVEQLALAHEGDQPVRIPMEGQKAPAPTGVNNEAPQPVVAQRVTEAKAPTSTEQGQAKPEATFLPKEQEKRAEETLRSVMPDARLIPHENLAKDTRDILSLHEELTGQKMHAYTGGRGRAFVHQDTAFFNVEGNKTPQQRREAVAHEAGHWLQKKMPELVARVLKAIPAKIAEKLDGEYAKLYKAQEGKALPDGKVLDERSALFIGRAFARPSVARAVMETDAPAFTRAVDAVLGKLRGLTAHGRAINEVINVLKQARGRTALEQFRAERRATKEAPSFLPNPSKELRDQAEEYVKATGREYNPDNSYQKVDVERAKKMAAEYDAATHSPNDPKVKASYDAFKKETLAQWNFLKDKGVKMEAWTKEGQPYANSEEMTNDVRNNKHLFFYQGGDLPKDHPTAAIAPGTPYSYNDVFRAVHDYFGHAKEGVGFGPRGEENAWRSHVQMYSPEAAGAMTAETRGQNSWVNFGPHGEANQANPKETIYAEQKATLLSPEFSKMGEAPTTGVRKLDTAIEKLNELVGEGPAKKMVADAGEKGIAKLDKAINAIHGLINEPDFLPDYKPRKEETKQAMEDLQRYLDPSEWESLSNPQVKRAIQIFKDLPPDVEFQQAALAGLAKKGWYQQAATALMHIFGKDTRRFVSLLAGDSPRQSVVNNLRETLRVWLEWEKAGRPTDPNILRPWLDGLIIGQTAEGQPKGIMSTRVPNLVRALSAPEGMLGVLSGYKVGSFQENLIGNLWKSTNDTWMAQFGDVPQELFSDNGGYLGYTAKVRRVAQLMKVAPANVQETVWSFFMTLANRINAKTTGQQALEQLTHEDIARAPAFADMLRDPQVNELLDRLGISGATISGAEEAARIQREAAPTGPVKTGANPILERIAERAQKVAKNKPAAPEFLPGKKFVEDDVRPLITSAGEAVSKAWTGVKSLIAPYARSEEAGTTRNILRERGADLAQRWDRLGAAFNESKKAMDKMDPAVTRDFIHRIETGQKQGDPTLQPIADALRGVLDDRLHQVQALGTGKLADFVKDYFPHIWKDPTKAAKLYADIISKVPLEGGKKFLRQRTYQLMSEGFDAGLTPVTENPVEAMMLRVREMDKYITAHQAFQELTDKGLLTDIKAREQVPAGYAKINDNIATIFAKPSRRGAIQIQGYKVAPEPVANVINNYLSPGLRSNKNFGGLFRGYLGASNLMNAAQLGLSGFHLAFTTMDSGVSKLALAIEQAARGQWKQAAKSAALTATVVGPAIENFKRGNQVMKEWYNPGSTTPEIASVVQAMKAAGGRAAMDDFYRTDMTDKMMQAFRKGNTIGGAIRAPFAAIEATSKPILESLVPRIKMGAFMDIAKHIFETNPGMTHDQLRENMRKAWDSVDNRLGEMVYDNLFWNKVVKDLSMASVRSVGWNLGTFRELGGGLADFLKTGKNLVTGNGGRLTHRMAYTVAMPVFTGIIGASINYMLTGKGPQELKDYFFPKTGEKDKEGHDVRLSLPSYMKDVFAYGRDIKTAVGEGKPLAALTTLKHKVHPMLNTILDMLSNEDYFGTKIRNEDDPALKQLIDVAKHAGKSLVPFGLRDVAALKEQGQGAKSILPLLGITKARQDITSTEAELKARELLKEKAPQGGRTTKAADKARLLNDLAERFKAKDASARTDLQTAFKEGHLTEADVESLKTRIRFHGLDRSIHSISDFNDAMKVWDVATPEERKKIGPAMFAKLRASKALEKADRIRYMKQLQSDWKSLKGESNGPQ